MKVGQEEQLNRYRECVRGLVSQERFEHCLGVEKEAQKFARIYGADEFEARAAAILHDLAKEMDPKEQMALIDKAGIEFPESERKSQKLWHAAAGMAYAKLLLNIDNEDILNAIFNHTTGRANMSLLEKIVMVSDLTSEDRHYENAQESRVVAETSLDRVIASYSAFMMEKLKGRGQHISERTKATFKFYNKSAD